MFHTVGKLSLKDFCFNGNPFSFVGSCLGLFIVDLFQRSWKLVGVNGFWHGGLEKVVTVSAVSDFSFASGNKLNSDPSMN